MTLGRLMELYQAEQQGKQIMVKIHRYGHGYFDSYTRIKEVSISDSDLEDLINDNNEDEIDTYFIKEEEDEYGNKIK